MTTLNLRRFSSYFSRLSSLKWTAMPPRPHSEKTYRDLASAPKLSVNAEIEAMF